MPKITLSTGKEFEIVPEKYGDYMAYLEEIFVLSDDVKNEKDFGKAQIKLQMLTTSLFTIEKRYQQQKLQKCVVNCELSEISVLESNELLQAIDDLSKPKIEEKN